MGVGLGVGVGLAEPVAVAVGVGVVVAVEVAVAVGVAVGVGVIVGVDVGLAVAVGVGVAPPVTSRNAALIGPQVWKPWKSLAPRPRTKITWRPTDRLAVFIVASTATVGELNVPFMRWRTLLPFIQKLIGILTSFISPGWNLHFRKAVIAA